MLAQALVGAELVAPENRAQRRTLNHAETALARYRRTSTNACLRRSRR
jgi:hypothetical protein